MGHFGVLGGQMQCRGGKIMVLQLQPVSFTAVCEGNSTCSENEVCVRPGECRCRHGYFGANCDTSEHGARWGLGVGQFGGKK